MLKRGSNGGNAGPEPVIYDEAARSLTVGSAEPAVVRAKSFGAFVALAGAHPDALSKDALIEQVWGRAAVSDDSVVQCIADIRRALGDGDHHIVQTVPGEGYRLTRAAVAAGSVAGPEPWRFPRWIAAACVAGVLAIGAGVFAFWPKAPTPGVAAPATALPSIAVVPFENLAGGEAWDLRSRALAGDIAVGLTSLDTLPVLSPTLIARDGASQEQMVAAFAEKGARYVMDGTLQASGAELRVTARLTDTETAEFVWVRTWDGPVAEFFAIRDEIVETVASELANRWSGKIAGLGAELARRDGVSNLDAYDHAQLGAERFNRYTRETLHEALSHFRSAIDLDPRYADAWASLSFVLGALAPLQPAAEIAQVRVERADAGRQAFHIDGGSAAGLLAASWTAAQRGNRAKCVERLRAAVAGAANDADILALASIQGALTTDLHAEALDWGLRALDLNADPPAWYHLGPGIARFFIGDFTAASEGLEQAPQGHPVAMAYLAAAHARAGQTDAAAAAAARLRMLFFDFSVETYLAAEVLYPADKAETLRAAFDAAGIRAR